MRILVHHQGQQLGPFTIEQLRAALAAGTVSAQDLAWCEGAPAWVPVTSVPGLGVIAPSGAPSVVTVSGDGSGLAVWSLILGILSLIGCAFLSGIPGVICGHMALGRKSRAGVQKGRGIAITGLVTGYAGTVFGTIALIAVVASLAIPMFGQAKSKVTETQSMVNARAILMTLNVHAIENGGNYPATLQDLVDKQLLAPHLLADPLAPEFGNDGYLYFRPAPNDSGDKVVLVGRGQTKDGRRLVAQKDGTVEMQKYSLPADL